MIQFINMKIIINVNADMNLEDDCQFDSLISVFNSSSFFLTVKFSSLEKEKVVSDSSTTFIKMFSNELYTSHKNYKYSDNLKMIMTYYFKMNQNAERRILTHININDKKM